jgi:hypothetical protein
MRRGESLNVSEHARGEILAGIKEKEISDGELVQAIRNPRMETKTAESIADNQALAGLRVEEGPHPEVIPGAKQLASHSVPERESEISQKMLDAVLTPNVIRVQYQRGVRELAPNLLALPAKLGNQIVSRVHARIGGNPEFFAKVCRLAFALGLACGAQHRVTQANRPIDPGFLRVRAAEGEKFSHASQEPRFYWGSF